MRKFMKNSIAVGLSLATMVGSAMPVMAATQYSDSTASNVADLSVGEDSVQKRTTKYKEYNADTSATTSVYITQASEFSVTVPVVAIISGTKDTADDLYKGYVRYSVSGNISADETINVQPDAKFKMSQKGKNDIDCAVTGVNDAKTTFTYADGIRKNQSKNADYVLSTADMTAGSWNGSYNTTISLTAGMVYYSTLEKAIEDANNNSTANADVKSANISDAEVSMYLSDGVAYINLLKDVTLDDQQMLSVPSNVNLNGYTLTSNTTTKVNMLFAEDSTVMNGKLILNDKGTGIASQNGLTLTNVDVTVNDEVKSGAVFGLDAPSGDLAIQYSTITANGANSGTMCAVRVRGTGANYTVKGCEITSTNNGDCYGYYAQTKDKATITQNDTTIIAKTLSAADCNATALRIRNTVSSTTRNEATITNCKYYATTSVKTKYASGAVMLDNSNAQIDGITADIGNSIQSVIDKANLSENDFSFDNNNKDAKMYGIFATASNVVINDKAARTYVRGSNAGIIVTGDSNAELNGGIYTSSEHGGAYIANGSDNTFVANGCRFDNDMSTFSTVKKDGVMYGTEDSVYGLISFGGLYAFSSAGHITLNDCIVNGGYNGLRIKYKDSTSVNLAINNTKVSGTANALNIDGGTVTIGKGTTTKYGNAEIMSEDNHNPTISDNR